MSTLVTLTELATFIGANQYAAGEKSSLLQEVLDAAEENVTSKVGPLASVSRTYQVRPNGRALVLPLTHVVAVASVTDPNGAVVDPGLLDVNLLSGIVVVPTAITGTWLVAAQAREHAASVKLAVKIIAAHLWETQRGGGDSVRPAFSTPGDGPTTPRMGFAIPSRAAELLAPFMSLGAH